jgi:hypothetical protein
MTERCAPFSRFSWSWRTSRRSLCPRARPSAPWSRAGAPVTLGAYQVQRDTAFPKPPRADGFITAMSVRVVDAAGNPIPVQRVMLHHLLFSNEGGPARADRVDGACPEIPRERFFGRGEEGRVLDLPDGYGYPISKGDKWRMNWMLMNHTYDRETAYIEYTVTIDDSPGLQPVTPFWLDVAKCRGGSIFSVPGTGVPGTEYNESIDWKVPFDGRIVEAGAHLHGGAFGMSLRQPRCGDRDLIRSRALYGMADDVVYRVLPVLHEPGRSRRARSAARPGSRSRRTSSCARWPSTTASASTPP